MRSRLRALPASTQGVAHALQARFHGSLYHHYLDRSPARLALAGQSAERAVALGRPRLNLPTARKLRLDEKQAAAAVGAAPVGAAPVGATPRVLPWAFRAVTQRVTNSRCRGRSIMGSPPYCAQAGRVGTAGADVIGGVPVGAEGAWLGVRIGCPIRTAYSL